MHSKEAQAKFKPADQLYRDPNLAEASVVPDELDKEFPDVKNILYPRAMCLARAGRYDEALEICRQLKVEFGDPRGESLMNKISALRKAAAEKDQKKKEVKATGPSIPPPNVFTLDSNPPQKQAKNLEFSPVFNPDQPAASAGADTLGVGQDTLDLGDGSPVMDMGALDDLFAARPSAPAVAPAPQPRSRKGMYVAVGIAAAVVIALVAFALTSGRSTSPQTAAAPSEEPAASNQSAAPEAPPIQWRSTFEDADNASLNSGAPVLLVFYSSATPSKDADQLDEFVWNEPSIRNLAQQWVCAKIDVDSDPKIKESFEIVRLPTTVLMDYSLGDSLFRREGSFSAQDLYKAATDYELVTVAEELPKMPVSAMIALPILFAVATFLPVFLTLLFTGRLPEDERLTAFLTMFLVGIVAPFLGRFVMRATYQLSYAETMIYYGLFLGHMFVFMVVMSVLVGMPFHIFLMAHMHKF